jgi:hypothetical protein
MRPKASRRSTRQRNTHPRSRRRCRGSGRKFSSLITGARGTNKNWSDHEKTIVRLLTEFDYQFGIKTVTFQARRLARRNGRVGKHTLGFHVVTDSGVVFLELADEFTTEHAAVLKFIEDHYLVSVVRITHAEVSGMKDQPFQLLAKILEAAAVLERIGATLYTDRILAAVSKAEQPVVQTEPTTAPAAQVVDVPAEPNRPTFVVPTIRQPRLSQLALSAMGANQYASAE